MRFTFTQRCQLWQALFEDSDEAFVPLHVASIHGLMKLWRGIDDRIETVAAEFVGAGPGDDDGKLGAENRRQVMGCIRQRPEALRHWVSP